MAERRHDWHTIRAEFVEGVVDARGDMKWLNLREVGERHGVAHDAVRRRAAEGRWSEERAAFQRFLEAQRREDRVRELSEIGVAFDRAISTWPEWACAS